MIKNARNNLLNSKRFVFPAFSFEGLMDTVNLISGEITWALLHQVRERDEKLLGKLRKASKLTFKTLHPGDNKQNVSRALNVFHPSSYAAIEDFPSDKAAAEFSHLFNTWWTMSNSKSKYSNNHIGNAAIYDDGKPEFLRAFAQWIKSWQDMQIQCIQRFTF